MKIAIFTNRDLASHMVLARLVQELRDHELNIFISEKVGVDERLPQSLMDLGAFEKQQIADADYSFDDLAKWAGCELQGFADLDHRVNSSEGLARICNSSPELIISVRFGLIIREQVIAIPKYGVLNLHSGVLPDYRGVMATFRAMINKESEIGSTLHFIQDAGVDTGDIISIAKIPLELDKSYLTNVLNLYVGGCAQILQAVAQIQSQHPIATQSQQGAAGYYSFPSQQELDSFFNQGYRLFDYQDDTDRY